MTRMDFEMSSDNLQKYVWCVTVRFIISMILYFGYNSREIRAVATVISSVFALGFAYKIGRNFYLMEGSFLKRIFGTNTIEKGFFGGKVWWHRLRYIHVVSWTLVVIFMNIGLEKYAWVFVFVDVMPGLYLKITGMYEKEDSMTELTKIKLDNSSRETIFNF